MTDGSPVIAGLSDLVVIGRGGFSTVYRARQAAAGRDVAVKVMSATLHDDGRARFERECQLLGRLAAHPGICTLYSWGETAGGHPYMVMELCRGTLRDRLTTSGPLPAEDVRAILRELAATLGHAHQQGIVHRDLKPENVLVTQFDQLVITDFGIARTEDGWHTTSGVVTASLAHAAPEVLDGGEPTPASDVWSLASTGYHLLTGDPPFRRPGEAASSMVTRVFRDEPPDLRVLEVPEEICAALEAALVKDPAARTPDMAAFRAALGTAAGPAEPRTVEARRAAARDLTGPTVVAADSATPRRRQLVAPVEVARSHDDVTTAVAPGSLPLLAPVGPSRRRPLRAVLGLALAVALVGLGAWLAVTLVGGRDDPTSSGEGDPAGAEMAGEGTADEGGGTTEATVDLRPRYCVRRVEGSLALRAEADLKSTLLAEIPDGDCTVRDLEQTGETVVGVRSIRWRHIEWKGFVGWAAANYLDLDG